MYTIGMLMKQTIGNETSHKYKVHLQALYNVQNNCFLHYSAGVMFKNIQFQIIIKIKFLIRHFENTKLEVENKIFLVTKVNLTIYDIKKSL